MINRITTAVFPVGGLGTRFLPVTKSMPKEMLPVVDKPLIQYAFEEAKAAGIEKFVFITGRNKNIISNHFDHAYELQKVLSDTEKARLLSLTRDWLPNAGNIAFIRQQEPLGLGHAIYCARNFVNGPFAVLLADEMFLGKKSPLQEMMEIYDKKGGNVIGVADVAKEHASRYGIIDPGKEEDNVISINGMVEKPSIEKAPSNISMVGRYILQPEIFGYLENGERGKNNEIQLTDTLSTMIKNVPSHAVRLSARRFDCGNRRGFLEANIAFALENEEIREDVINIIKSFVS